MKKHVRIQRILVLITVLLLVTAVFLTIQVDGLAIAISVIFPFSFLILIMALISFVSGFRKRKEARGWYRSGLLILGLGILVLWTPIWKSARSVLERNWRWEVRQQVVEDIRSGKLQAALESNLTVTEGFADYYVAVPLETYGRVSFEEMYGDDNSVEVHRTPETGYIIIFTTNAGFFGPKDQLVYVEKKLRDERSYTRVDEHWYLHTEEFSLFSN